MIAQPNKTGHRDHSTPAKRAPSQALPTPTTIYAQALVGTALSGPIRIDLR